MKCDVCHKFKLRLHTRTEWYAPGMGLNYSICSKCLKEGRERKSFAELMGIGGSPGDSKFARYVGVPRVNGQNAFGSVLAEYENGAKLGVICFHGGSAWLCLKCAVEIMGNQVGDYQI